jgi:ATP-binding cassette subfamily C protein CydCD
VLDEPAEHLEAAAADALTADVLGVTEGRAALLITHRLAGLDRVDEIVVLERGAVVERGTHAALLEAGGRYAAMWWEERMGDRPAHPAPSRPAAGAAPHEALPPESPESTPSIHEGGATT